MTASEMSSQRSLGIPSNMSWKFRCDSPWMLVSTPPGLMLYNTELLPTNNTKYIVIDIVSTHVLVEVDVVEQG